MRWPIDDRPEQDPAGYSLEPPLTRAARERLVLERAIARRLGFTCFAEYYRQRRSLGWGINRLTRETGQTRDWILGVMRRYGGGAGSGTADEEQGLPPSLVEGDRRGARA